MGDKALLYGRQLSDYDIVEGKFSPIESRKIITYGKENIRFWRIKKAIDHTKNVSYCVVSRQLHILCVSGISLIS